MPRPEDTAPPRPDDASPPPPPGDGSLSWEQLTCMVQAITSSGSDTAEWVATTLVNWLAHHKRDPPYFVAVPTAVPDADRKHLWENIHSFLRAMCRPGCTGYVSDGARTMARCGP